MKKLKKYYYYNMFIEGLVVGLVFPIIMKMKGLQFTAVMFSGIFIIEKVGDIIQPVITKLELPLISIIHFNLIVDYLWSIIVLLYLRNIVTQEQFLIVDVIVGVLLSLTMTTTFIKMNTLLSQKEGFESFQANKISFFAVGSLASSGIFQLLSSTISIKTILFTGVVINFVAIYLQDKIRLEIKNLKNLDNLNKI